MVLKFKIGGIWLDNLIIEGCATPIQDHKVVVVVGGTPCQSKFMAETKMPNGGQDRLAQINTHTK